MVKNLSLYLINNPSNFLKKKFTSVTGSFSYANQICCQKCFSKFRSPNQLAIHEKACLGGKETVLKFPKPSYKISFNKPWLAYPHLLCGFVDFESILIKESGHAIKQCSMCFDHGEVSCGHKFTNITHSHKAVNYSFVLVDREMNVVFESTYTGDDAIQDFLSLLTNLQESIEILCQQNEEMIMTDADKVKIFKIVF